MSCRKTALLLMALVLATSLVAASGAKSKRRKTEPAPPPEKQEAPQAAPAKDDKMPDVDFPLTHNLGPDKSVFTTSRGWKVSDFYGKGKVRVEGDTVFLDEGNDMTGITWRGPLVRMNYTIECDAKRTAGGDFFCGLTFPYGKDPCSFIVGGWGGTCVGISSLDHEDAYNNETARFQAFEDNKWYHIKVRVTPKRIECWIDDEKFVDVSTEGRTIGIRWEVEPSVPLGIATWRTGAAIRNVKLTAFGDETTDAGGQQPAPNNQSQTP